MNDLGKELSKSIKPHLKPQKPQKPKSEGETISVTKNYEDNLTVGFFKKILEPYSNETIINHLDVEEDWDGELSVDIDMTIPYSEQEFKKSMEQYKKELENWKKLKLEELEQLKQQIINEE